MLIGSLKRVEYSRLLCLSETIRKTIYPEKPKLIGGTDRLVERVRNATMTLLVKLGQKVITEPQLLDVQIILRLLEIWADGMYLDDGVWLFGRLPAGTEFFRLMIGVDVDGRGAALLGRGGCWSGKWMRGTRSLLYRFWP